MIERAGWVSRPAQAGFVVILVGLAIAVLGSVVVALADPPTGQPGYDKECTDPPCFGGGGLPGVADLPMVISMLAYVVAVLLGVPAGVLAIVLLARRMWRPAIRRLVPAVGPLVVLAGIELVPHLLNVCFLADMLSLPLPGFCRRGEHGVDVADRWHVIQHTVFGAIPLLIGYWWALRKWYPHGLPRRFAPAAD